MVKYWTTVETESIAAKSEEAVLQLRKKFEATWGEKPAEGQVPGEMRKWLDDAMVPVGILNPDRIPSKG